MSDLETDGIYQQIVEAAGDAIIYATSDGVIALWNAGAERIFGYSADEAVGQRLDLIIPEQLQERHWTGWTNAMQTGESRYSGADLLAVPGMRRDGTRVSLEFSVALLRDEDGVILGVAAILRDVSERFQRDRELRERLAQFEHAAAATNE